MKMTFYCNPSVNEECFCACRKKYCICSMLYYSLEGNRSFYFMSIIMSFLLKICVILIFLGLGRDVIPFLNNDIEPIEKARSFERLNTENGIFHSIWSGTITLFNGKRKIVIMDKNLGAEVAWLGENSYGHHFQRGNNHGFPQNQLIKKSHNFITGALTYWIHNPYSGEVFILGKNYRIGDENPYLWGKPIEMLDEPGLPIKDGKNTLMWKNELFQWPCPEGFHIPSYDEWMLALDIWREISSWSFITEESFYCKNRIPCILYPENSELRTISTTDGKTIGDQFREDFLLPFAGGRGRWVGDLYNQWVYGYLRTASPERALGYGENQIDVNGLFDYGLGFSLRCFKD